MREHRDVLVRGCLLELRVTVTHVETHFSNPVDGSVETEKPH